MSGYITFCSKDYVKQLNKKGDIGPFQKPLKLDKNGCPTSISLSGFTRKMSDETFEVFEELFLKS